MAVLATVTCRAKSGQAHKCRSRAPAMMTEPLWWRLSAGRRFAQGLADLRFEKRPRFLFVGETMIRHASLSRTVAAISGSVHGATTWSCLIAPPSFLLLVATGFLRAGSDAVNMTSVTPATDKNLRAAASTQKHSARNFIDTCGSASPALRIIALCIYYQSLMPKMRKRGKSRGGQGERALARMIWGIGGMTWLPGTANRAPR